MSYDELVGRRVKARPLGHHGTLDAPSELDTFDPYDGPSDEVTGILEVRPVVGWEAVPARVELRVDGVAVDPSTVHRVE